jgi:hypothetical protein
MGIVSIIKEEISGFLNEKEYASEDIINPREINLQEEYDKLNNLLFGGSLSKVPLKWDTSKRPYTIELLVKEKSNIYQFQTFINYHTDNSEIRWLTKWFMFGKYFVVNKVTISGVFLVKPEELMG